MCAFFGAWIQSPCLFWLVYTASDAVKQSTTVTLFAKEGSPRHIYDRLQQTLLIHNSSFCANDKIESHSTSVKLLETCANHAHQLGHFMRYVIRVKMWTYIPNKIMKCSWWRWYVRKFPEMLQFIHQHLNFAMPIPSFNLCCFKYISRLELQTSPQHVWVAMQIICIECFQVCIECFQVCIECFQVSYWMFPGLVLNVWKSRIECLKVLEITDCQLGVSMSQYKAYHHASKYANQNVPLFA